MVREIVCREIERESVCREIVIERVFVEGKRDKERLYV